MKGETVQSCQQRVEETSPEDLQLQEGVDLTDSVLTKGQQVQMKNFLSK